MAAEDESARSIWRLTPDVGPRSGLVLLIVAHLVVTYFQSWPLPYRLPYGLGDMLGAASGAILLAQLSLIAAYVTLGGGRWIGRVVRGALLLLWFELAHMAGTHWLDSGRDSRGFEESLGTNVWAFAFLALPLLLYRCFARRRIALPGAAPAKPRMQFRIMHLLLIMTEAAAVMGTIRAFVAENDEWRDELWRALRDFPFEYASYDMIALSLLAAIPAVLVTLRWRSLCRAAIVLLIWALLLSVGFAVYRFLSSGLDPEFPIVNPTAPGWMWGFVWLHIATICLTIALVIWLTLAIVRWLGYDFLPLPRRGGGRHSSEATSAA